MDFTLVSGKIIKDYSTDTTWGVYLTPTGYEKPLKEAPIQFIARRSLADRNYASFTDVNKTEVRYKANKSFVLRLINVHTAFGKPTKASKVDIRINKNARKIEISTPSGKFIGRGAILHEEGTKLKIRVLEEEKNPSKSKMNLIK